MKPREDAGRVLLVAGVFFGGLAAAALAAGLPSRFSGGELGVLAAFAVLYAVATYALDRSIRAFIDQRVLTVRRLSRKVSPFSLPQNHEPRQQLGAQRREMDR